jgi:hypothetical protein
MAWVDRTSYSYAAGRRRGETEPRTWELVLSNDLRIAVTRLHGVDGLWFLKCHDVHIDELQLAAVSLEAAQAEALRTVAERVERWSGALATARAESAKGGR